MIIRYKFIILFLVSCFVFKTSYSQINKDSLWSTWENTELPDSSRLLALNNLAWYGYLFNDPDSAYYLATLQYKYARKIENIQFMGAATNIQGGSFYIRGNYDSAVHYYSLGLTIYENAGELERMAPPLNNIGNIYKDQGNYAKAIQHYLKSLDIYETLNNTEGISLALSNIGLIYSNQKEYEKALEQYQRSLKIAQKEGNQKGIATAMNNMGLILERQADQFYHQNEHDSADVNYKKALEHYLKALELEEKIGNLKDLSATLVNVGSFYQGVGKRSLNKKDVNTSQNQYALALTYFERSLKIDEEVGNLGSLAGTMVSLASINNSLENYELALKHGEKGLKVAQEVGLVIETKEAASNLYRTYKNLNKPVKALEMHELFVSMKDSIQSEENQNEIMRQEFKHAYEQEKILDQTQYEKDLLVGLEKQKQQKLILIFVIIAAVSTLVFLIIIWQRLKVIRTQKSALENAHEKLNVVNVELVKHRDLISTQKRKVEEVNGELNQINEELSAHQDQIEHQNKELALSNHEILASISYAKRIQDAILPTKDKITKILPESCQFYKPKDIVSGDFYWVEEVDDYVFWAAVDCTGHGVPGAFLSLIGHNGLQKIVSEQRNFTPSDILEKLCGYIIGKLGGKQDNGHEVLDGMDMALCCWNKKTNMLTYSGAGNPLYLLRNTQKIPFTHSAMERAIKIHSFKEGDSISPYQMQEFKGSFRAVGPYEMLNPPEFVTYSIQLEKGDILYVFSDGFADQFGPDNVTKYSYKRFRNFLHSIKDEPMTQQGLLLENEFINWYQNLYQLDDICVFGVKVV